MATTSADKRTGFVRPSAVLSCAAPDDDQLNLRESRFPNGHNGSFATQSNALRTQVGRQAESEKGQLQLPSARMLPWTNTQKTNQKITRCMIQACGFLLLR